MDSSIPYVGTYPPRVTADQGPTGGHDLRVNEHCNELADKGEPEQNESNPRPPGSPSPEPPLNLCLARPTLHAPRRLDRGVVQTPCRDHAKAQSDHVQRRPHLESPNPDSSRRAGRIAQFGGQCLANANLWRAPDDATRKQGLAARLRQREDCRRFSVIFVSPTPWTRAGRRRNDCGLPGLHQKAMLPVRVSESSYYLPSLVDAGRLS
jgi:hypothetical protein